MRVVTSSNGGVVQGCESIGVAGHCRERLQYEVGSTRYKKGSEQEGERKCMQE